jgi:uncharacterized OB-fold protein
MNDPLPVQVCSQCGSRFFPHRLACGRCGSRDLDVVAVAEGVVDEMTLVRRSPGMGEHGPVPIATVRLGTGPQIVARVPADARAGVILRLRLECGGPVGSRHVEAARP